MKWFLGVLVVLALVVAALFGVGYFALAPQVSISRDITIERPRATLYALAADLDRFNEWSPWRARSPERTYTFNGPQAGKGQQMFWTPGGNGDRGGNQTITETKLNEQVDYELFLEGDGFYRMTFQVARGETANTTLVRLTAEADCGPSPMAVTCRYLNLLRRTRFERDFDDALSRLKTRAEQLPTIDFEGLRPSFVTVPGEKFLFVPATTPRRPTDARDQPARVIAGGADAVSRFMADQGLNRAGDLTVVTTGVRDDQIAFQVGYPFSGPSPQSMFAVQVARTPSGRAMRISYQGSRSGLSVIYEQAGAYLRAHGIALQENAFAWEVYKIPGDPADDNAPIDVDIYFPIRGDTAAGGADVPPPPAATAPIPVTPPPAAPVPAPAPAPAVVPPPAAAPASPASAPAPGASAAPAVPPPTLVTPGSN